MDEGKLKKYKSVVICVWNFPQTQSFSVIYSSNEYASSTKRSCTQTIIVHRVQPEI